MQEIDLFYQRDTQLLPYTLANRGYFNTEELCNLRHLDSNLSGHPDMNKVPGVDASTGSLGQGLSIANGMALSSKLDSNGIRVYCLLGDRRNRRRTSLGSCNDSKPLQIR